MKSFKKIIAGIFALIGMVAVFSTPAKAAPAGEVGYNIQAVIPGNQVDKKNTFFDLRMKTGQKQTLTVMVNNTSSQDATYKVQIIQAYTNNQGFIDYNDPKETKANDYPFKIGDIITTDPSITVPANSTKKLALYVTMPDQAYDGQILAAVKVTKNGAKSGQGISTTYGYVLGIKLTENSKTIKRDVKLLKVSPAVSFGKTSIVATLENPTMDAIGHLVYDAVITNRDTGKVVRKVNYNNNMQLAPNSIYKFAIDWKNKEIEPGKYHLKLTVSDALDNKWVFNKNFTITNTQAKAVNDATVNSGNNRPNYTWLWILIGVIVGLAILGVVLFFILRKRKQEQNGGKKDAGKKSNTKKSGSTRDRSTKSSSKRDHSAGSAPAKKKSSGRKFSYDDDEEEKPKKFSNRDRVDRTENKEDKKPKRRFEYDDDDSIDDDY